MTRKQPRWYHVVQVRPAEAFTPTSAMQSPLAGTVEQIADPVTHDRAIGIAHAFNSGVMTPPKGESDGEPVAVRVWAVIVPARDCPRLGDQVRMQVPTCRVAT